MDDDTWTIARTDEDGVRVLFRFRAMMPAGIEPTAYPHLVNIYWRYDGSAILGMPPVALQDQMLALETRLDTLEGPGMGFLVLAITGNNRKEWIWYVADRARYMERVNTALAAVSPFPVEFEATHDANWDKYRLLLATLSEPSH